MGEDMITPELDYRLLLYKVWRFYFKEEMAIKEKDPRIFFGKVIRLWQEKNDKWGRVMFQIELGFKRKDSTAFLKWLKRCLKENGIDLRGMFAKQFYASALFLHGNSNFCLEFIADFLGVSLGDAQKMRDMCEELRKDFVIERLTKEGLMTRAVSVQ